jgi:hypothetical protein
MSLASASSDIPRRNPPDQQWHLRVGLEHRLVVGVHVRPHADMVLAQQVDQLEDPLDVLGEGSEPSCLP